MFKGIGISAGLFLVALVTTFSAGEAQAQAGSWQLTKDEYGCHSVYRKFDTHEAWIERHDESLKLPRYRSDVRQTYPYSIRLRWLRNVDQDLPSFNSLNSYNAFARDRVIRFGMTDIPPVAIDASGTLGKVDEFGNTSIHPQMVFFGESRSIDWFGVAPRTIDYFYKNGRIAARFIATDLANGFAKLKNCQPAAAPPNRMAQLRDNPYYLVDIEELLDTRKGENRRTVKAFNAAITVSNKGLVTGCTVRQSTGLPAVDTAICKRMQDQAMFVSATDANGKPIASTYSLPGAALLPQD